MEKFSNSLKKCSSDYVTSDVDYVNRIYFDVRHIVVRGVLRSFYPREQLPHNPSSDELLDESYCYRDAPSATLSATTKTRRCDCYHTKPGDNMVLAR